MDNLITTTEAQALFDVRPGTLRQWLARGVLYEAGREGRRPLFRRADIERLLPRLEK
jgi:DNA-binding transcriptional MerR regulator